MIEITQKVKVGYKVDMLLELRTSVMAGENYQEIHAVLYIMLYSRQPNQSPLHGSIIDRIHMN